MFRIEIYYTISSLELATLNRELTVRNLCRSSTLLRTNDGAGAGCERERSERVRDGRREASSS